MVDHSGSLFKHRYLRSTDVHRPVRIPADRLPLTVIWEGNRFVLLDAEGERLGQYFWRDDLTADFDRSRVSEDAVALVGEAIERWEDDRLRQPRWYSGPRKRGEKKTE